MSFPHKSVSFTDVLQIVYTSFPHMFGGIVYGVVLVYVWKLWKLLSRTGSIQLSMFFLFIE